MEAAVEKRLKPAEMKKEKILARYDEKYGRDFIKTDEIFPRPSRARRLAPGLFFSLPLRAGWLPDYFSLVRCVRIGFQIIFPSSAACGLASRLYFPRPLRAGWLSDYISLVRCVQIGFQVIFPSSAARGWAPRLFFPRPLRADRLPDCISLVRCVRMGSQIVFPSSAACGSAARLYFPRPLRVDGLPDCFFLDRRPLPGRDRKQGVLAGRPLPCLTTGATHERTVAPHRIP